MIKYCDNCKYYELLGFEEPCSECNDYFDKWEAEVDEIEEKDCDNCKYEGVSECSAPCCYCDGTYNKWEPREVKQIGGDLVDKITKIVEDQVNQPAHYTEYPKEVYEIIKYVLGDEGFKAWCIGNELKYRLRAGLKDPEKLIEDIQKAMKIREWRK